MVCLPAKLAQSLGGMGRIATVHKVNSLVHLIDPNTGQCMYAYAETLDPYTQYGYYGLGLKGTSLDTTFSRPCQTYHFDHPFFSCRDQRQHVLQSALQQPDPILEADV